MSTKISQEKTVYETYSQYSENMILRDHLAVDRTLLANERTYLSYLRTVVSFIVAGLTLWKTVGGFTGNIICIILFSSAIYAGFRGNKVYKEVNNKLDLFNLSNK
ncbi:MAG: DUF202 domain-containing protein [Romboutsia sp.]|uniref:DUF202 domain-containing protein n=1 Tax=Romboutsia sp. TaxID=1965302 RepID=UPI003F3F70BC